MITKTNLLELSYRPLSTKERKECEKTISFCQKKLIESPEAVSFLGKIFDSFSNTKELREIRKTMIAHKQKIIEKNSLWSLKCKPMSVINITEYEDEGHYYIFDVGNKILFFMGGQDYVPTKNFPNTNFEITELGLTVLPIGKHLNAVSIISGKESKKMIKPAVFFTFPGQIETALNDYNKFINTVDLVKLNEERIR